METKRNDLGIADLFPPGYQPQISGVSVVPLSATYRLAVAGKARISNVIVQLQSSTYYPAGTSFVLGKYFDGCLYFQATQVVCRLDDPEIPQAIAAECNAIFSNTAAFGCCSQYVQCSNARHCVHNNLFYANGCTYRKSLEAGRIFYGVNRNV